MPIRRLRGAGGYLTQPASDRSQYQGTDMTRCARFPQPQPRKSQAGNTDRAALLRAAQHVHYRRVHM
jgi:hypothetical protein